MNEIKNNLNRFFGDVLNLNENFMDDDDEQQLMFPNIKNDRQLVKYIEENEKLYNKVKKLILKNIDKVKSEIFVGEITEPKITLDSRYGSGSIDFDSVSLDELQSEFKDRIIAKAKSYKMPLKKNGGLRPYIEPYIMFSLDKDQTTFGITVFFKAYLHGGQGNVGSYHGRELFEIRNIKIQ